MSTFFAFGYILDSGSGPHIEADNDGPRGRSQHDVGFADRAGAAMTICILTLSVPLFEKGFRNGFQAALHIGLQYKDFSVSASSSLAWAKNVFEGNPGSVGQVAFPDLDGGNPQCGAQACHPRQPGTLLLLPARLQSPAPRRIGRDGPPSLTFFALVVGQGAHPAVKRATQTKLSPILSVPSCTSTVATRAAPAPLVQARFDNMAAGGLVQIGLGSMISGLQGDKFEKLVKTLAGLGRYPSHDCIPAPSLPAAGLKKFGKLAQNAVRVRAGLVHLVDSFTTMGTTFAAREWLMASLVCSITPSSAATTRMTRSVTCVGAAGAHGRECLVAGCVKKDNFAALCPDMVRAPICWVMPPASPLVIFDSCAPRPGARSCHGQHGP